MASPLGAARAPEEQPTPKSLLCSDVIDSAIREEGGELPPSLKYQVVTELLDLQSFCCKSKDQMLGI